MEKYDLIRGKTDVKITIKPKILQPGSLVVIEIGMMVIFAAYEWTFQV